MRMIHCNNTRRRSPASGQALVEFALIAPVFFALLFIIIELGIVLSIYVGLTNTAREAARAGSMYQIDINTWVTNNPTIPTPPLTTVDGERETAMDQAIMARRHPMIQISTAAGLGSPRYSYEPTTPATNRYRYGDKVIVTLSYTHQFFFNLLGSSITLSASSEMRLEPGGR